MPEGHSVRRLADAFASRFEGRRLAASSPQGRFAEGAAILDGRMLERADAHGKHMFLGFEGALWLRVHLGMYGMWRFAGEGLAGIGRRSAAYAADEPPDLVAAGETMAPATPPAPGAYPPPPVGAVRLRLDSGINVADLSGPAACVLMTVEERDAFAARLGEDPLRADADPDKAFRDVARSRTAIAALLMRQDLVSGIGNIYRADLLFRAALEPHKPGRELARPDWDALWTDAGALLREGVRLGRIVTTRPEHRRHRTGPARREDAFYVAHRAGLPCRICDTPVSSEPMAGRTLFWCARCQRR